jgi:hypothetical protein
LALGKMLIRMCHSSNRLTQSAPKIQSIRGNGHLAEGDCVIEFPHVASYPETRLIQS